MLRIEIPSSDLYNEDTEEFITIDGVVLDLEHSLVSLSKWESKFQKPFLSSHNKSEDEVLGYIECMIVTKNFPADAVKMLSQANLDQINEYINSKESATIINEMPGGKGRGEIITSELIYFWMINFSIPFECEFWHLNRLFSLIQICNIKNSKTKPRSRRAIAERNRQLNEQRKAKLGTRG